MAISFSSAVEQWRAYVQQIANEYGLSLEWVDKVLWTIQGESRGDPNAIGDNGSAVGLLQIHNNESIAGRPTTSQLLDPYFNIRYAATSLGMVNNNFAAWGENNLYNGQPFGALGLNPFPGSGPTAASTPAPSPSKPNEWINNPDWYGGGAWRDPQSGKYWDEQLKDWIVAPRSILAPVPSTGISAPTPVAKPTTQPMPTPNVPVFPTSPPAITVPTKPWQAPTIAPTPSSGINTPVPTAITPAPKVTPGYAGIPQSMLTPGQWNEVTIGAGGVQVNDLQGWTAWERQANGNWQQYAPGEYLNPGSRVGLLPVGMSMDMGRNPR